jgi:hypothetical protein
MGSLEGELAALFLMEAVESSAELAELTSNSADDKTRALYVRRPGWQTSNHGSTASNEMEDDGNNRQYQQYVDKERSDVEQEEASQPQQKQNESQS